MPDTVCPSCMQTRPNPRWCLDQYHMDGTKNNPVYDKLVAVYEQINGCVGGR